MPAPASLPGVYLETVAPPLAEVLPRMDIAAFVGFAAAGPLHTPVPVEGLDRFRELFGPDLPLARDDQRGEVQHAHLGPAVEAFFRQGGRRCWVVRVAGEPHRHRFEVPGLVRASDLQPAVAHARSGGSWADGLRVGSVLEGLPLRAQGLAPPAGPGGVYRVTFDAAPGAVLPGELLEVDVEAPGLRLWLFAATLETRADGLTEAVGAGGVWLALGSASPPDGSPALVGEADALDSLAASSPGGAPLAVRRLRFTLEARTATAPGEGIEAAGAAARLAGLSFHPAHPRFWGHMPSDEELFRLPHSRREPPLHPGTEALRAESASPRFPVAGPGPTGAGAAPYLPLGMALEPDPEAVSGPLDGLPGTRLGRDGLEGFDFRLFVDPDLQGLTSAALRAEAEHKLYRLGRPLHGLHALLPVDEATLVAVPDAAHPGWTRQAAPAGDLLAAPVLKLHPPDRYGLTRLTWSAVEGADEYRLERSPRPDFARREVVYRGPEAEAVLDPERIPEAGCHERLYLRVRARRLGAVGPWSNTEAATLPEADFTRCDEAPPPTLVLELAAASPGPVLAWRPADTEAGPPLPPEPAVELEEAADPAFAVARTVLAGTAASHDPGEAVAIRYYRVRARADEVFGPWSNTVVVPPEHRAGWTLLPPAEPALDLLAVQRALLRLCAARRDLVAVLALPRGAREETVREHLRELRPGGSAGVPGIPPLTPGEREALAFGAAYHPWVAALPAQRSRGQRIVRVLAAPPEGTVCGAIARRTVREGAWIAPANEPFAGVLALEPALPEEAWSALTPEGVNLLVPAPRGFLVLSERTLTGDGEVRPLHVRRLLILLRRLALREGATYVFEPHSPDSRGLVRHRFERLLNELFARGAFAGREASEAFRVVAGDSVNPAPAVAAGRFVVELRVAPSQPLAFLVLRLVQEGPEQLRLQEV